MNMDTTAPPLDKFFNWTPVGPGEYIISAVRARDHLILTTNTSIYRVDEEGDHWNIRLISWF